MRRRPPLPLAGLRAVALSDQEERDSSLDHEAWEMILKRGLNALEDVRRMCDREVCELTSKAEVNTALVQALSHLELTNDGAKNSEESSSLYSFWHDIGLTLSEFFSTEELSQKIAKWTNTQRTIASLSDDVRAPMSLTATIAQSSPKLDRLKESLGPPKDPEFTTMSHDHVTGAQRWRQLFDQHGTIIGPHGGSRDLTWEQLISPPLPSSLASADRQARRNRHTKNRADRRRKRMRAAKLRAEYRSN